MGKTTSDIGYTNLMQAQTRIIQVSDSIYQRLNRQASADDKSVDELAEQILAQALENMPHKLVAGKLKGKIWIADDFDETSQEILDTFYGESAFNDLTNEGLI